MRKLLQIVTWYTTAVYQLKCVIKKNYYIIWRLIKQINGMQTGYLTQMKLIQRHCIIVPEKPAENILNQPKLVSWS